MQASAGHRPRGIVDEMLPGSSTGDDNDGDRVLVVSTSLIRRRHPTRHTKEDPSGRWLAAGFAAGPGPGGVGIVLSNGAAVKGA